MNNPVITVNETLIRELGAIEMRMALFHQRLKGSTQGIQVIDFSGDCSEEIFFHAASHLFKHYEPLQCCIGEADETLYFYNGIDIDDVDLRYQTLDLEKERETYIRQAVNTPIDANKALWRLSCLQDKHNGNNYVLILSAHHTIIDADGMQSLADTFLKAVDALNKRKTISAAPPYHFPLAVDNLLQDIPLPAPPEPQTRKHDQTREISQRETSWQTIILSEQEFAEVNDACDRDGIKFHSFISAILCQAMKAAGLVDGVFNFGTAVSLRFLQDSNPQYKNPLGCYMSIASNKIDSSQEDTLALAKRYERELMHQIMIGCLGKVQTNYKDFCQVVQKLARADTFSQGAGITNMAEVNIKAHYGDLRVTDYRMLANRCSANFSIVAHCYTFSKRQIINLVYPYPNVKDDTVIKVAERLRETLRHYAKSSKHVTPPTLACSAD